MPDKKIGTLKLTKIRWQEYFPGLILGAIIAVVIGVLIFNYFTGTPKQEAPREPEEGKGQRESGFQAVPLPAVHKVGKGENLVALSQKYYQDQNLWPGIAKENKLEKPGLINPNQEVKIPKKEDAQKTNISDLRKTGREKITNNRYTVDYGDTLFEIAQRAYQDSSKWTIIDQTNKLGRLPNGNPLIHAGNVLIIPR